MKRLVSTAMVVLLLGAGVGEAAGTKRAAKTSSSGKASSNGKSSSNNTRTVNKRRSSSRQVSRRPSRPTQPTPERYKEFQQALADKGFYDGPIDGVWTAECVEAVKRFQESENLTVDGKLGARSIIALGLGPQRSADSQFLVKPPAEADEGP